MAIFFPLFTLLEDLGYLPRVAFNLDRCFQCARACGKQSLTMLIGLLILQMWSNPPLKLHRRTIHPDFGYNTAYQ